MTMGADDKGRIPVPHVGLDAGGQAEEGFVDRYEVAEDRCRSMASHGFDGLYFSHHLQGVAIKLTGQIATDRPPGIAPVVGSEKPSRTVVESRMTVGADDEGRIPVPHVGLDAGGQAPDGAGPESSTQYL